MTAIFKKLQSVVENTYKKLYDQDQIMPVPVEKGILVGKVLIVSRGAVKDLLINGSAIYTDISLNASAIKLANILSKYGRIMYCDTLYKSDQDYGKWLQESQLLRSKYQRARQQGNDVKADIYLARYCTARDRAKYYHSQVLALISK